jgi:hypothetical protein
MLLKKDQEIMRLAQELQRMKIASENEIKKIKKQTSVTLNSSQIINPGVLDPIPEKSINPLQAFSKQSA